MGIWAIFYSIIVPVPVKKYPFGKLIFPIVLEKFLLRDALL